MKSLRLIILTPLLTVSLLVVSPSAQAAGRRGPPRLSMDDLVLRSRPASSINEELLKTGKRKLTPITETDRHNFAVARDALVVEYLHRPITSEIENLAWIDVALKSDRGDQVGGIFLDFDSAVLKDRNDGKASAHDQFNVFLNPGSKDKDRVTAEDNLFKFIAARHLAKMVQRLRSQQINVKISYKQSDWKAYRVFLSGPILAEAAYRKQLPPEIENELHLVYKKVTNEFREQLKARGLYRPGDSDPRLWFRMAGAFSANHASGTARLAREDVKSRKFRFFNSPETLDRFNQKLTEIQRIHKLLVAQNDQTGLMIEQPFSNLQLLSQQAWIVLRKYDTVPSVISGIYFRLGKKLNEETASNLIKYAREIATFSSPPYPAKREAANLSGADFGGMSADFLNLGAQNMIATEQAAIKGRDLDEVFQLARLGEQTVTDLFNKRKEVYRSVVEETLQQLGIAVTTICSGDDCVSLPIGHVLSEAEKEALITALSKNKDLAGGMRISFIGPRIEPRLRTSVSVQGETIEKFIRERLIERNHDSRHLKLLSAMFAVDMNTSSAHTGPVNLMVGLPDTLTLTKSEQKQAVRELEELLEGAIDRLNADLYTERNINASYSAGHVRFY